MKKNQLYIVQAALIAAFYFVLTAYIFQPISFYALQFRVAEAMMLLPALIPAATPGLFIGCLLANFLNPASLGLVDIIFGSLATLLAALITAWLGKRLRPSTLDMAWKNPKPWLLTLPTIISNGLIVGVYLPFLLGMDLTPAVFLTSVLSVAAGEAGVTLILGVPLLMALSKSPMFRKNYF